MIDRFLKAKHWEIFILTTVLPLVLAAVPVLMFILSLQDGFEPDVPTIAKIAVVFIFIIGIGAMGFFGWLWSMGIGLQRFLPPHLKQKVMQFKISFFIPFAYFLFLILVASIAGIAIWNGEELGMEALFTVLSIVLMYHFISMFCMVFCFYFASKAAKMAELQQDVTFGDYVGEFFMIWFYYIGVWVLQPKLNKLMEEGPQPSHSE